MGKTIYSAEHRALVGVLRDLRERAGVRQVDLAETLGRPQSFVSKYEQGERRLDLVEVRHIAEALGVKLVDVVKRFEKAL